MTVYYAQCDFLSIKDNQYTYLQSIIIESKVKQYLINVLIYDTQAIYSLNKIQTTYFDATWYIRQLSSRPSANRSYLECAIFQMCMISTFILVSCESKCKV